MMGRAMGASSRPRFLPAVTGIRGIINVFLLLAYLATRRRVSI